MSRRLIGIDIGGSGIKGAPVDVAAGTHEDRIKIPTPTPATPDACAAVVAEIVDRLGVAGPVGVTIPSVVVDGVAKSTANIDASWIDTDARSVFAAATGRDVLVINDADAAGIAEMTVGAAKGRIGTVVVLTFGTGIGSAVFRNGVLLPNTELGHIEFRGGDAEHYVNGKMRNEMELSEWMKRVNRLIRHIDFVLGADLVVFGGGISKEFDSFANLLDVDVEVVPAHLRNYAGIVGAAMGAAEAYPA